MDNNAYSAAYSTAWAWQWAGLDVGTKHADLWGSIRDNNLPYKARLREAFFRTDYC